MPFVDLLTHILPSVDDGPETVDESVQMAHAAAHEGADTLVATPLSLLAPHSL
jgi:protein-tyrosine phosphatase